MDESVWNCFRADIHRQLLFNTGTSPDDPHPPPYLFLLSPRYYVKSDTTGGEDDFVQFSTDARVGDKSAEGVAGALQLARRYIIVGSNTNNPTDIGDEFSRLLESAAHASFPKDVPAPKRVSYTMGVFMNQTSIEVLRHIGIDGRPTDISKPRLETWGGVVGTLMLPVLLANSVAGSTPLLEVQRITATSVGSHDPSLLKLMKIRFHTTEQSVLNAARVGEGDQFYATAQISKVLRQ
jgi:hypothetical protein